MDSRMAEYLIAFGIFALFLAINKKLFALKVFFMVLLVFLILIGLVLIVFKLNFRPFVLPFSYLLVFQPIVRFFIKRNNRMPILYLRGVQLTPQEELDISIDDYVETEGYIFHNTISYDNSINIIKACA